MCPHTYIISCRSDDVIASITSVYIQLQYNHQYTFAVPSVYMYMSSSHGQDWFGISRMLFLVKEVVVLITGLPLASCLLTAPCLQRIRYTALVAQVYRCGGHLPPSPAVCTPCGGALCS